MHELFISKSFNFHFWDRLTSTNTDTQACTNKGTDHQYQSQLNANNASTSYKCLGQKKVEAQRFKANKYLCKMQEGLLYVNADLYI